ncbi:LCP family protein [Glycomyces buryatensis]|uniref:LytR family transcriptional regulator n=1 Tax=Glycomyces buryatensis TaxID=2570927 RepID=A0A4S8QB97_9ACTN|nr:LCP family protein [Glycomyces buryatensis]THV40085.1 LytR family transcriptional regulator [Glycomyces buryatensis]
MSEPTKHAARASAPWWAKTMVITGSMVMVIAGGGAIAAQVGTNMLNSSLNSDDLLGDQRVEAGEEIEGPLNFLVLGTDERVGAGGLARTDADIIVHINEDLTQITMVSLPRDLLVDIPSGIPADQTKLTEAFAFSEDWGDSFGNTAETITALTDVSFNGGAIANFEGFLDLVDELGTIELCPWHEITSIHTDVTYPEGCADYDKDEALDIVRQRYVWDWDEDYANGTWGDFGRQKMQQQSIMKVLEEAKAQDYHKNPIKAVELLNSFGEALTIDLGGYSLTEMITQMANVEPSEIISIGVPSSAEDINGTSYVVTHEGEEQEAADSLYQAINDDTLIEWACQYPEWTSGDEEPDCSGVDTGDGTGDGASEDAEAEDGGESTTE